MRPVIRIGPGYLKRIGSRPMSGSHKLSIHHAANPERIANSKPLGIKAFSVVLPPSTQNRPMAVLPLR
ncbi:hypothetical protein QO003_003155 [Arthrobacter silviterrae]|nr:hypothetical protein [Arthrobacter silviterrae]